MNKAQFIDRMILEIRERDISEIIGDYVSLVRRGYNFLGLCPFHNDKTIGSFVVSPHKGIYKCFSCGHAGDAIKFVSSHRDIHYLEAAFEIALSKNIISSDEYDEYFVKRRYDKKYVESVQATYEKLDNEKMVSNIGSPETLDKVFTLFLEQMKLNDEHREYLMNERSLNEETIEKRGYKTFPTAGAMNKLINTLNELGMGVDTSLEVTPGFYQRFTKDEWKWEFAANKGIVIPIKDSGGLIIGLQIRRDEVDEDRGRYLWFSSSFAQFVKNRRHGTSSGSPMDILYPDKKPNKALFITEGRFKSETIVQNFNSVSISVQGVSSWKDIDSEIKNAEEMVKTMYENNFKFTHIYIAFDSDMAYKHQVYHQLKRMSDSIQETYPESIYYLNWDGAKGIDDYMNALDAENHSIRKIKKPLWDEKFAEITKAVLEEHGVKHLRDIDSDILQEQLKEMVKPSEWKEE